MTTAYVDASALAKLVLDEPESPAMHRWYEESTRVLCSRVGIVETRRAVARHQHDPAHLEAVLRSVDVVELDADVARSAGSMAPSSLRAFDAIHIASALKVGGELDSFVTYDDRQATAARDAGLAVVRPA